MHFALLQACNGAGGHVISIAAIVQLQVLGLPAALCNDRGRIDVWYQTWAWTGLHSTRDRQACGSMRWLLALSLSFLHSEEFCKATNRGVLDGNKHSTATNKGLTEDDRTGILA